MSRTGGKVHTPDDYFAPLLSGEITIPSQAGINAACPVRAAGWWGIVACEEAYEHEGFHVGHTKTHRVSWSGMIYSVIPITEWPK